MMREGGIKRRCTIETHDNPSAVPDFKRLFTPLKIGRMELKNRIVFPAIDFFSCWGELIADNLKYYLLARAQGGTGLIMMAITSLARLTLPLESKGVDRCIKELSKLTDAIHAEGAAAGMQIHHEGAQNDEPVPGLKFDPVGPSPIRPPWGKGAVPRELSLWEIEELIDRHVLVNSYIKRAGFDLVEVKACHGYLFNSFLSPLTNKREDEYGCDLRGRTRIITETIRRTKEALGTDFAVSCRFSGSDYMDGGLTPEDAPHIAQLLEEAGADLISVSAGIPGSYPTTIPTYHVEEGCFAHLAEPVRRAVKVPVVAVGRITGPVKAEEILAEGKADLIAIGRGLLADPELPNKARRGELGRINKCLSCNQGCFDVSDMESRTCLVNPLLGREEELAVRQAKKFKDVMVIGGGPAGLEAAFVLASRGHSVTLFERERYLGGQVRLAAIPPKKEHFLGIIDYLSSQAERFGVKIVTEREADLSLIKEKSPDAVIIATGASPLIPTIPGVESEHVVTAWDVLKGNVKLGKNVLVVGGNSIGLEVAEFLAARGSKVTVIEMLEYFGSNMGRTLRYYAKQELKRCPKVTLVKRTKIREIIDGGVLVIRDGNIETWNGFDTIVLAVGSKSINNLEPQVRALGLEVHIIGDALEPRNCLAAIREGFEIGRKL